mmetsp:Transcript_8758/g.21681  ORF Transcript_8758/g.21681 Transcript_8758/m.21681 type:complete len:455 (-) Transcript_8758:5-1369(-)
MVGERAREVHGRDRACLAGHIVASLNQKGGPDVEELRRISAESGLLSRALRRRVWPILLNLPTDRWGNLVREDGSVVDDGHGQREELCGSPRDHPEKKQVELDVVRSLSHFGMRARDRSSRLPELSSVITSVLKSDSSLHYYQGFNDVCSIALVVMGSEEGARPVAERLAKHHFRAAMLETMEAVQQALRLIVGILRKRDPALARSLEQEGVDPIFAISWILTWFAHNLHSLPSVERVYDFLLGAHPSMSLYLSAALLQHHRTAILAAQGDYPTIHALLQELPSDLPLERLIASAALSFKAFPPAALLAASSLAAGTLSSPRGAESVDSPHRTWLTLPSLPAAGECSPAARRAGYEDGVGVVIRWQRPAPPSPAGRILKLGRQGLSLVTGPFGLVRRSRWWNSTVGWLLAKVVGHTALGGRARAKQRAPRITDQAPPVAARSAGPVVPTGVPRS